MTSNEAELRGNPTAHSCWLEESANKVIAATCRSVHRAVFETKVLVYIRSLLPTPDKQG